MSKKVEAEEAVVISFLFWVCAIFALLILGYLIEIGLEKSIVVILQLFLLVILIIAAILLFSLPGVCYIILLNRSKEKNEYIK